MTIDALDVVNRARVTLIDLDEVTWSDDELMGYFNEGVKAACNLKPDLYVVTGSVDLDAGPKQTLPDRGLQIFDVVRDLVGGNRVTQVQRQLMGDVRPDWPNMTQTAAVKHFMTDNDNVQVFWVYPPNDGTGSVEAVYGAIPDDVVSTPHTSPLSANYDPALHAYICALALAKNTSRQDLTKSTTWMQTFVQLVTGKTQTQLAVAPRSTQPKQD